jgi:hypothetical protein
MGSATKTAKNDGSFYADGRLVFRAPKRSSTGTTLGFQVCELVPGSPDEAAPLIAKGLNLLMQSGEIE